MFVTIFMASGIQFIIMDDDMIKMLPEHLDSRRTWTLSKMNLEARKSFLSHLGIKGNPFQTFSFGGPMDSIK